MTSFKITDSKELEKVNLPCWRAEELVTRLEECRQTQSRCYISKEDLLEIIFDDPRFERTKAIISRPGQKEDDIAYGETADIKGVLGWLAENHVNAIPVFCLISCFPKKAQGESLFEIPADVRLDALSMCIAVRCGIATPMGASRSEKMSTEHAENLFALYQKVKVAVEERLTAASGGIGASQQLEAQYRERSIFLIKLRGHHFREKFPWLGYDGRPLIPHAKISLDLLSFFSRMIQRAIGTFYRYPLMAQKYEQLLQQALFRLAKEKRQGKVLEDKKIQLLNFRTGLLDDPLTLALSSALVFKRNIKNLEKILGKEPGQVQDWIKITTLEWEDGFSDDLREFYKVMRWPKLFLEEISPERLEEARRAGMIIEGEKDFKFSDDIMAMLSIRFVDFLAPEAINDPVLKSRYDFVFNIKFMEYLTDLAQKGEQVQSIMGLIDLIDSGQLLFTGGHYFCDGNKLRAFWNSLSAEKHVDILPLYERSLQPALKNYPGGEIEAYQFTGRAYSRLERMLEEKNQAIAQLEARIRKFEKMLATDLRKMSNMPGQWRMKALGLCRQNEKTIEDMKKRLQEMKEEVARYAS